MESGTYYNDLSFRYIDGARIVRKATHTHVKDLMKEISFIRNLPYRLKPFFPEIISFGLSGGFAYYDMPEYGPSLRKLLLKNEISFHHAFNLIRRITDLEFTELLNINKEPASDDILIRLYFDRIKTRLSEVAGLSGEIASIIEAPELFINSRKYYNVLPLLSILENCPEFLKAIRPKYMSMVHGDFHLGNFLINTKEDTFILIDPRGEAEGFDCFYDIGKILHSLHGLYDLIHEGVFDLKIHKSRGTFQIIFNIHQLPVVQVYKKLYENYLLILKEWFIAYGEDTNAMEKALFAEALHFCSLALFHLQKNGNERCAVARYLTGTLLLNDCFIRNT